MLLFLPWPKPALSPNARTHWALKSRVAKGYKSTCHWTAKEAKAHLLQYPDGPLKVEITFHPPNKRKRDLDNLVASFKSGQDGVADAMGVDDARFIPTYSIGDVVEGGSLSFSVPDTGLAIIPVKGVIS